MASTKNNMFDEGIIEMPESLRKAPYSLRREIHGITNNCRAAPMTSSVANNTLHYLLQKHYARELIRLHWHRQHKRHSSQYDPLCRRHRSDVRNWKRSPGARNIRRRSKHAFNCVLKGSRNNIIYLLTNHRIALQTTFPCLSIRLKSRPIIYTA